MTKIQKFKIIIFIVIVFAFNLIAKNALAARLYFESHDLVVGTEKDFSVGVLVDAENQINAVSVGIFISPEITLADVVLGNSIINFWVDKPNFDDISRILTFSGIIPGGFKGEKELLLTMKLKTNGQEEKEILNFNKEKTKIYLNTADGIEDSLELESLTLLFGKNKENIATEAIDNIPPENFKPEITSDPNIFEEKQFLVFATQDKKTGVERYEVKETRQKFLKIFSKWIPAESPYVLKDQKLRSYVYVKAIDKAGNERVATIEPFYPFKWYDEWRIWGIMLAIIIGVCAVWRKIKK